MPQQRAYPITADFVCLTISLLFFPISLQIALCCFVGFLIIRINLKRYPRYDLAIKAIIIIAIALATFKLFVESRSLLYPVSYFDYLLTIATVSIIRQNFLSLRSIQGICKTISLSPFVVFICNLSAFSFNIRNHWGFGNPNWLGLYCSMCLPLILCLLVIELRRSQNRNRLEQQTSGLILLGILVLVLGITFFMLISSGSRSALYTSLLILSVMLWRLMAKCSFNLFKKLRHLNYLSLLLSGVFLAHKLFIARFDFLGRFVELTNSTNIYRIKLYKCHLALGMQKPWTGWGINQVTVACEQKLRAGDGGVNHAHNFILQLFVDYGLIVTVLSLLAIFYFFLSPTLSLIAKPNFGSLLDILHLGISASSASIIITSLFQSGFYHYPLFPLWLGLMWGCQLSLVEHQQNSSFNWQTKVFLTTSKSAIK